jgi:hypothetical protein
MVKSSEKLFEGMTYAYQWCLESDLEEEGEIIQALIKRWDDHDHDGHRRLYETMRMLMREHAFPRRMPSQLELDLESLKVASYAASKAQWDVIGHLSIKRTGAPSVKKYSLFESLEDFQAYQYRQMRGQIVKLVNEGLFTFGRDEDDRLALTKLEDEEE